jgi:type VI secretion system secreted protein Hcp
MILVRIESVPGDVKLEGYTGKNYFVADSFSFGVEREMKESGEKGGTEDMNIGVGELQECTISKSMDLGSARLAQVAINGNALGAATIDFVEVAGDEGKPTCYLRYHLDRCWVKSWSTSGDADDRPTEEVAFYYNKITFGYSPTTDGKIFGPPMTMAWDNVKNVKWAGAPSLDLKTSVG